MSKCDRKAPRLSELPGNASPDQCAKCGGCHLLARWQEHDHNDQPEARVVVLCDPCAERIIEPHPRMYRRLMAMEFCPGSSAICMSCAHRVGMSCRSPRARFNGGTGLEFKPEPVACLVDGARYRGLLVLERDLITWCSGHDPKP